MEQNKRGKVLADEVFVENELAALMGLVFKAVDNYIYRNPRKIGPWNAANHFYVTGSTATTVVITKTQIMIANAGDSTAILVRGGACFYRTKDHNAKNPSELERIKATRDVGIYHDFLELKNNASIDHHGHRTRVSRAFGDFAYKKDASLDPHEQAIIAIPEVRLFDRNPADEFIILGSDGFWKNTGRDMDEVVRFVNQKLFLDRMSTTTCVKSLLTWSVRRGKRHPANSLLLVKLKV